jgi:hypothetical protein
MRHHMPIRSLAADLAALANGFADPDGLAASERSATGQIGALSSWSERRSPGVQ